MEKKADTKMETKSLIIRPSRWEDIGLFYEWETKPEVTEFFSIRDGQTEEDVVRKYIKDDDDPAARQFTILLKKEATGGVEGTAAGGPAAGAENAEPIGRIVLADIEEGWKAELWRIYIADTKLRGEAWVKKPCRRRWLTALTSSRWKDFISIITPATRQRISISLWASNTRSAAQKLPQERRTLRRAPDVDAEGRILQPLIYNENYYTS